MIRKALTILALILAVLLVVSAAGCASVELTQQKSDEVTPPEDTEAVAASESLVQPAAQEQTEQAPGIDQSDAEYDDVKTWSWAPYETLYRTDGVRMGLVREADGTRHIGEVPDTKVWIRLKDGTLLSDEPFDACIDYMGEPEGEVYCIRNGTGYRYTVSAGDGSFRLSEVDEEMGELFLMEQQPTQEQLIQCIRRCTLARTFVPVFMGSAFKNKGVQLLLDGVVDYLPAPNEVVNKALDMDDNEKEVVLSNKMKDNLVALAFKLEESKYGQLT